MTEETPKLERVLVGRQRELTALWSQFEKTTPGRLHVTLVAGEPGIGKTRLLHEVAGCAEQVGGLVLRGGASEAEGMPPYLPFWRPSAATSARLHLSNYAPRSIPSRPSWRRFCQSCRGNWAN